MKTTIIVWLKAKTCRHVLNVQHMDTLGVYTFEMWNTQLYSNFFIGHLKKNDSANTGDNSTNAGEEKKSLRQQRHSPANDNEYY